MPHLLIPMVTLCTVVSGRSKILCLALVGLVTAFVKMSCKTWERGCQAQVIHSTCFMADLCGSTQDTREQTRCYCNRLSIPGSIA